MVTTAQAYASMVPYIIISIILNGTVGELFILDKPIGGLSVLVCQLIIQLICI